MHKVFATMIGAILFMSSPATASPAIFLNFPVRPNSASAIKATAGTIKSYRLVTSSNEIREQIVVRDAHTGTLRTFLLSAQTTINGTTFRCAPTPATGQDALVDLINQHGYCRELPHTLVPGMRVALAYWDPPSTSEGLFDSRLPATDFIVSLGNLRQSH